MSSADADAIAAHMEHRRIFPAVASQNDRGFLLARLFNVSHRIPSLHTFIADTIYLEACSKVLRRLLPVKFRGSLRAALSRLYSGANQEQGFYRIQTSKGRLISKPGSQRDGLILALRQFWLCNAGLPAADRNHASQGPRYAKTGRHWQPRSALV
jgi:hypothetical protein